MNLITSFLSSADVNFREMKLHIICKPYYQHVPISSSCILAFLQFVENSIDQPTCLPVGINWTYIQCMTDVEFWDLTIV